MKQFYVYVWYENKVPIYVGKGTGKRAFRKKSIDVEIFRDNLTEQQAFELEKVLIKKFGRKDKGLGTLENLTDGGGLAFHTFCWEQNNELYQRFLKGIEKRQKNQKWRENKAKQLQKLAKTRPKDWQDSLYLIQTPSGIILELKTQQLKQFCTDNGLDFNQIKQISRTGPVKRKSSRHYGYKVAILYNKVTKQTHNRKNVEKLWEK